MSVDRKYTPGGTDHTDGDYQDDHSIASRAGRLFAAERGRWPGGRGRLIGTRLHELIKDDGTAHAEAARMIAEGFTPLTTSGEMGALDVSAEFVPGREDVLGNSVDWTDNTSGDSLTHERSSGRKG